MNILSKIFELTCNNRYFELEVAKAIKAKLIKIPTYLSVGEEHIPASIAVAKKDWLIFPQHRGHSYYLSFSGPPDMLAKELLGRKDGCNKGMGGSASISCKEINLYGHSGLLSDQVPIAVGAANASNKPTLVIAGDAAWEEDYALASLGYAITKKSPVLFICEDNNLSILTEKKTRRSWEITNVANGFGIPSYNIEDDPWEIYSTVLSCLNNLPSFININTCRHLWHSGNGCDGLPKYNRFEMFKKQVNREDIEQKAKKDMEFLWYNLTSSEMINK